MLKRIFSLAIIILHLSGCDEDPTMREFPIIRTLNAYDVNSTGATFRGELVKTGKNVITSYGFVWGIGDLNEAESERITLGSEMPEGKFETRINFSLSEGFSYKIRAFACYGNKTVYGNTVFLLSKGCEKSAWSMELTDITMPGWDIPYGCSDGENGYVIFQDAMVYRYDPVQKSFSRIADFPVKGNSGTQYTSVSLNNVLYVFSNLDKNLYKLTDGKWSVEAATPFYYGSFGGYYHGYTTLNQIFLLSSSISYNYKPDIKYWQSKSLMPATNFSVGGTDLNGFAYVMDCAKNIKKYDPLVNSWQYTTTFPGVFPASAVYFNRFYGKLIGFACNNNLYFGFGHDDDSSSEWIEKGIWAYNLTSDTWKEIEAFPKEIEPGKIFYFFLKGKLYIGHKDAALYTLYSLDASKI